MSLSSDLISQFVKATNDKKKPNTGTTVNGTFVMYNGKPHVQLDGSDLLTPVNTTADALEGESVVVTIKDHTATVTGNTSSPAARTDTVKDLGDQITEFEIVVADKVDTAQLNAQVARIDTLVSDNVTINKTLTAYEADITNLKAADVTITGKLTVNEADIETLKTTKLDASVADLTFATIKSLEATNANIHNLTADYGAFKQLSTDNFSAIDATVKTLDTTYATIESLDAEKARIALLEAGSLTADSAVIKSLEADIADIDTLIFGSASGNTIQTSFANAVIAQLGNAQIKSAMIESISADKITAGDIITNNVRVMSEDGKLLISDETIQISDNTRVRVQIGKDAANDYSINIWDANGKLMFSKGGLTEDAIKEAIIRDDMVSETANIKASKLDISSLFEEINGSAHTINSSKVYIDADKQTLDVAFTSLTTDMNELGETVTSQGTSITTIQDQISSKIWQQDIETATNELNEKTNTLSDKYSSLEQNLNSISATVGSHTTQISNKADTSTVTTVSNKVSDLELSLDGFKTTVSSTYATYDAVEQAQSDITNIGISNSVYEFYKISDFHTFGWAQFVEFMLYSRAGESIKVNISSDDSVYKATAVRMSNTYTKILNVYYSPSENAVYTRMNAWANNLGIRVLSNSSGSGNGTITKIGSLPSSAIEIPIVENANSTDISTLSTNINQTSEQIELVASNLTNNYYTKTESESKFTVTNDRIVSTVKSSGEFATSDAVTTAANNAQKALDDINTLDIGGRNLLLNTNGKGDITTVGGVIATTSLTHDNDGILTLTCSASGAEIYYRFVSPNTGKLYIFEPGETYTFSCKAKIATTSGTLTALAFRTQSYSSGAWRGGVNDYLLTYNTSEWVDYERTFTVETAAEAYYISMQVYYSGSWAGTVQLKDIKLEKGNRATDWTPAPEDVDSDIYNAYSEANEALAATEDHESRLEAAESTIKQLVDSISMIVTDENGTSLFEQTSDGWSFNLSDISNGLSTAQGSLKNLSESLGNTDSAVEALEKATQDIGDKTAYVDIGKDANGNPCLILGKAGNDFKVRITNTAVDFLQGSNPVAYVNNQSLYITTGEITGELRVGSFVLGCRPNGNFGIQYKGG